MRHIGIVGVTAEGSALCYRLIVSKAAKLFGSPIKHPEITIHNFSFHDYFTAGPTENEGWRLVHDKLLLSIKKLKMAGADFAIIPANTVHHNLEYVEERSLLPIINVIDITVDECEKIAAKKVCVLGTHFIMSSDLYQKKLMKKGILQILPSKKEQQQINLIINDLVSGKINKNHTTTLSSIIENLNCDSVILACTELPLVIKNKHTNTPLINTTELLAEMALKRAIT